MVICGISPPFGRLSPARGKVTHVLLTRAPLYRGRSPFSCDLHVLSAPLTFVLSQDQTLQLISGEFNGLLPPFTEAPEPMALTWLGIQLRRGSRRRVAAPPGPGRAGCESHFGIERANCSSQPRALGSPLFRGARCLEDKRAPHQVSVRFSFQGPREPCACLLLRCDARHANRRASGSGLRGAGL